MKTESYLVLVTILSIIVMGLIVALIVLHPEGLPGSSQLQSSISVSAQGFAYGYPSRALLYVGLNGTGPTADIATSNASLTLQRLNFSIRGYIGENVSRIRTLSYSLYKVPNSSTYEVNENLQILIPEMGNLSQALENLSSISNVYVSSVSAGLSSSQTAALRNQALSEALANATAQAEVLSKNATLTVRNISVNSYNIFPYSASGLSLSPTVAGKTLFYSGQNQLTESITVLFSYG